MDKLRTKKELLDSIRLQQGPSFECEEEAIIQAYEQQTEEGTSLAIKILSIIGGFLASLAFIGFLFIADIYDSEWAIVLSGIVFVGLAIFLNKTYDRLIIETFSVSIYISGLILATIGLFELRLDEVVVCFFICLIAIISLLINQTYSLSFIAILSICISILSLLIAEDLYDSIHFYVVVLTYLFTYVMLKEAKIVAATQWLSKLYLPLRIALLCALLMGLFAIGNKHLLPLTQNNILISSIGIMPVLLYLVWSIIRINEVQTTQGKSVIYVLSGLILIASLGAPAIVAALLVLLLSFMVNYKTGLVIGVLALVYFVMQYYYDLNLSLLSKSMILLASGLLFVLLYLFTRKHLNSHEEL